MFERPKVGIIGFASGAASSLRRAGFAAEIGSFGQPYQERTTNYPVGVKLFSSIPYRDELDIIIVNTGPLEISSRPPQVSLPAEGALHWHARPIHGYIDPRPLVMADYRQAFDRLLSHGSVFVVFGTSRESFEYIYGKEGGIYAGFQTQRNIELDNWSFLEVFSNLEIVDRQGSEITFSSSNAISKLLSKYSRDMEYKCAIEKSSDLIEVLATGKFGEPVAAVFKSDKSAGKVILVPQQIFKTADFLLELVQDVLPEYAPELYPDTEEPPWSTKPPYELREVIELDQEADRIEAATDIAIAEIELHIREVREQYGFLHDLLTASDRRLVVAVKQTLEYLGFPDVTDVDELESSGEGASALKREDLRIMSGPHPLLIEVKGISTRPKEDDALAVGKYFVRRIREWGDPTVTGLTIINHQRNIPPLQRENDQVFQADTVPNAIENNIGLMTTWDLFRLAVAFKDYKWNPECVRPLFYKIGRIEPIPTDYEQIGKVERIASNLSVVGVTLDSGELRTGDRIAFITRERIIEDRVLSLQVDNTSVDIAASGPMTGVKVIGPVERSLDGAILYRVSGT
jgi:hypothetical protein